MHWLAQQAHPDNPQDQAQLLDEWEITTPEAWNTPGVSLDPGQCCALPQAHQRIEAALAELEMPYGHQAFAVTYQRYTTAAMGAIA